MSLPGLLLSLLLASLYGVAFYLLFGRGWIELGLYCLAALLGFGVGQLLSATLEFTLLPIGTVNVIEASAMSLLFLFLTRTLWRRAR